MPDTSGAAEIGGGKKDGSAWLARNEQLQEPLSEWLCRRLRVLLDDNPDVYNGLDLIGLDVQYGFTPQIAQGYQGYYFALTVRGAFLGHQHNLTNSMVIVNPLMTDLEAKNLLYESCKSLKIAKAQQAFPNGQLPPPGLRA